MLANAFQYAREQRLAVVAPDFPNLESNDGLVNPTTLRHFINALASQSTGVLFIATTAPEGAVALAQRLTFNKTFRL
ncbi:hypothetical protein KB236_00220 [Levilactobacillus brevis]|nr:hypothetical protein KB236_00220 [Levilactobacillus brevis]